MKTALLRPRGANVAVSPTGADGMHQPVGNWGDPNLRDVDFSDPAAVDAARIAIRHMEVWEEFVSWAMLGERGENALEAIVDVILCQQAAVWQRKNGAAPVPADGLGKDSLPAAQARFFDLLSTRGVEEMMATYEFTAEGIQYMPSTGEPDVDHLLCMTVDVKAFGTLGRHLTGANDALHTLVAHAQEWLQLDRTKIHAARCSVAARLAEVEQRFSEAAIAHEQSAAISESFAANTAVAAWDAFEAHEAAADSYCAAAEDWMRAMDHEPIHRYENAARAYEKRADLPHTKLDDAAWTWGSAARCWRQAGKPARAATAADAETAYLTLAIQRSQAFGAWQDTAQLWEKHADAWLAAGFPDRAAALWKTALHVAPMGTMAADVALTNGTTLFGIELCSENAWNV